MPASPDTSIRLALVGTGAPLVRAIEALRSAPAVQITVVADGSDKSDGGKLAKTLQMPLVKNAMEVFRANAQIVLEVNGDERQYERLLSIKPPGVEVMSVRGARLLIDLFKRAADAAGVLAPAATTPSVAGAEPARFEPLTGALQAALRSGVTAEDAATGLLPAIGAAAGMEMAGLAAPAEAGFSWILGSTASEHLTRVPAGELGKALGPSDPTWLSQPAPGLGLVGLLPLRAGDEGLGLLVVGRVREGAATAEEVLALRLGASLLATALRATRPVLAPGDPGREVVREVPVEVVREVVKEVPIEVVREVVKEVVKEVPVPTPVDDEEMRRLRRRVEELQTTQEQLALMSGRVPVDEKMQALLNMAGGVGHVFNNVLAGILGRTQLLLKRATREKSKDLLTGLNEIEAATRTGIDALTRIQEFSRSRPVEAFAPVDFNDIVQRAVEETRPIWRDGPAAKGVRIELITHFGPHSRLIGAESELLAAVVQLIANAVAAMPGGGTLTIRTGLDSGRGVASVTDTGVGMEESVKRRAFEPFFSTKGETGLGLGLSMVYGAMARHGGEVTVESEEGKGTTVTLRVPTSGEGAPVQVTIADADRRQILLVDDDETVRTAIGDALRGAGYAVTLGASGLEGVAKVREREGAFDLIITDLGMPDVPGWEVVEAVKQVEATTPVVIMSGFDRARATRRAKELGVDFVISKPFDIQEFLNTIRGLVVGRKRA